jgi:hypothetical protein
MTNKTLNQAEKVTSCPFRVTLGLFRAMLASRSKTLGLLRPLDQTTRATWHTTASKVSKMLGDVKGHMGDIMGLQGLHHSEKGKTPLGPGLPGCLWWNVLLSLWCKPLICLCPLAGVSTSIWWDFSPMEVRTNHLPMCTCPSGVALQQQQVRPPWAHKSQGS